MSMMRAVAISLKIPDNEAHTALQALRRLGVDAERMERFEVWRMSDEGSQEDFLARVERNETMFNPNKHEAQEISAGAPRDGEVWVEMLDSLDAPLRIEGVSRGRRCVGWRLYRAPNVPADNAVLQEAAEKLLCNPAIERAIFP